MINTINSELLKIRTLRGGWATAGGVVAATLLALLIWYLVNNGKPDYVLARVARDSIEDVFTAGQYFGLLLTMIFGVTLVTSEYSHQTVTATFLATPKRGQVVLAKTVAGVATAFLFFLVSAVLSVGIGFVMLKSVGVPFNGISAGLGAVCLNALAYMVWAVFGIGLGTLIRNQVAAVVVGVVGYLGELGAIVFFGELSERFDRDWISELYYYLPGGASQAMTSVQADDGLPPWWVATIVLLAYGVIACAVGTAITKSRDVT